MSRIFWAAILFTIGAGLLGLAGDVRIVLAALPGLILVVLGLPTAVVAAIVGRLS